MEREEETRAVTSLLENHPTGRQGAPMLDRALRERLRHVCLRIRRCLLLEGLAWVAGFMAVSATLQGALDYGTHGMRWSMRATLLALIMAGGVWLIWRRIVSSFRLRPGLADAANLVERRYPQLSSVLISALRFSDGQVGPSETNSPALVATVIGRAAREATGMDYGVVVDSTRARRSAAVLLATVLIGTTAALAWPGGMSLWFSRNILLHNDPWPKQTTLLVELTDGILLGARGDDLVVDARAEGVQPRQVEIFFETESGQSGRESMVTVGSKGAYRYRYTFKTAQEDFVFHLRGGDDRTEWFQARLRERPRVVESRIHVVPPPYSQIASFTLGEAQQSVEVLLGTEVTLSVRANKPLRKATLVAGTETVATARTEGDYQVAVIHATKTHTYYFALVDETGLENKEPVRFSVRVSGDDPPRARLKLPGVGDMITPEALLPIELDYSDTYGLDTAELIYQVSREGAGDVEQTR